MDEHTVSVLGRIQVSRGRRVHRVTSLVLSLRRKPFAVSRRKRANGRVTSRRQPMVETSRRPAVGGRCSARIFEKPSAGAPSRYAITDERERTNLERLGRRARETSETASPSARSNRCIAAARFERTIRPRSSGFGQPRPPSTLPV